MKFGHVHVAEDNCIRLDDIEVPVYRIFTKGRFLEMCRSRKLVLVRPKLWDDPFENFLYRIQCESADGDPVSIEDLSLRLYGQCWSLNSESDAMWRIYAPDKNGIKVRTTVKKLIHAIYDPSDNFSGLKYFVGRVQYADEKELLEFFDDPERVLASITDTSGRAPVELLLLKRREFQHEEEVRLIFQRSHNAPDDIAAFAIDPSALFEEIVIDPRIPEIEYRDLIAELNTLGFTAGVRRSALYQLPIINGKLTI